MRTRCRLACPINDFKSLTLVAYWGEFAAVPAEIPHITKENARELAKLSWDKRRAKKAAMALQSSEESKPSSEAIDYFIVERLTGTREVLTLLQDRMLEEVKKPDADGQRLSWLATASDKLNNQEFDLAGRSKPKPGQGRAQRRPRSHGPPSAA